MACGKCQKNIQQMKERWMRNPKDERHQIEDITYSFILNAGDSKCKGIDENGKELKFFTYTNIIVFRNGIQLPFRHSETVQYPGWIKDLLEQSIIIIPSVHDKTEIKIRTINIVS